MASQSDKHVRTDTIRLMTVWLLVTAIGLVFCPQIMALDGPLFVHPNNGRYFTADGTKAILLAGSHTWLNLQDAGYTDPPPAFDYNEFLDSLQSWGHNFFRLWSWEQAAWCSESEKAYFLDPMPFVRTGPGLANDGKPRFDLTRFDDRYFDRLKERVRAAQDRGFYVSVMLFDGWSIERKSENRNNPWRGHPFNKANNVQGLDGDLDGDDEGSESHSLLSQNTLALQEAYVRHVIETVNEFDNVLYEISNESPATSQQWQYHMIDYIHWYESFLPKRHPVGMTVEYPDGDNDELFSSPADWIGPTGDTDKRPIATGSKVILADTDHLCGICGDRAFVWMSFLRGENPIFMDQFDCSRGNNSGVGGGISCVDFNKWTPVRTNLGYARRFAERLDLARMLPFDSLASTGYCLAEPGVTYLIYQPNDGPFTIDLSSSQDSILVEWFDPKNGEVVHGEPIPSGQPQPTTMTPPMDGEAVLYLYTGNSLRQ